jgi:ATPase
MYIPTIEVIRKGLVSKLIEDKKISGRILIPWSLLSMLEDDLTKSEASSDKSLTELEKIKEFANIGIIGLKFIGDKTPPIDNVFYYIIDLAIHNNATIIVDNPNQARLAKALGAKTLFVQRELPEMPRITKLFDESTMSVHLKEGVEPRAKKGKPGDWKYVPIKDEKMVREEIEEIIEEIIDYANIDPESFIETDKKDLKIIQIKDLRIVIVKPPFSDGYEVTAVRPIRQLSIEDYNLPYELIERLGKRAEGILIAGAPGEGKSTFAQALAEFYMEQGKVVKTIEAPRDLQLPMDITQYSKAKTDSTSLHDILLLSRPDYTIFDEMRTTDDFELFIDLRLAGVGMVGIVHATSPIDAIQRFVERIDLGMIPSVLDTVIFLKGGEIKKVYEVVMVAKVPHGLTKEELARPVVEVRDFFTKRVEYELYVFGKRVFVIPVSRPTRESIDYSYMSETPTSLEESIKMEFGDISDDIDIKLISNKEAIVFVPPWGYRQIRKAIRRKVKQIKRKYGVKLIIEPSIGFEE